MGFDLSKIEFCPLGSFSGKDRWRFLRRKVLPAVLVQDLKRMRKIFFLTARGLGLRKFYLGNLPPWKIFIFETMNAMM